MIDRRSLLSGATGAAAFAASGAASALAGAPSGARVEGIDGSSSAGLFLPPDDVAPADVDRLPLSWSKERTKRLQETLAANGLDGILLTNQWNIIYFTGLWHTTTERMIHCFIPAEGDSPIWFYPALDRDLIRSWWFEDGDMYFDWLDVEGAFPHRGEVFKGPTHDLWLWLLEGLKRRGFAGKPLAVDQELIPTKQNKVVEVLGAPMADAQQACLYMRMRKTPLEVALTRRAYGYFDRIHAFARDLILQHGTDLIDYEIANAAEKFGTDLIMNDLEHDGKPHSAVGVRVGVSVRAGQPTGYPHPNQFYYNRVERGQALQVAGVVRIGGCGGELYRPYMIGPRTAHMEKLWTAARDACLMQKDLSRKGTLCSDVAYEIHKFQVGEGVQDYIYHRPAHGEGMEGHQPPYLSLGDHTVLDTGMMFSVEPGLFDPVTGTGANFSDGFIVREEGPSLQMSRLPWSEEWAWIDI
ncbi:peptidase M24 [Pacificimonas flava]|uniref:Peptidase M24 n=2 Tax=Pacificimonas TaxID=1960290 RepID=A0A219B2P1_9SPHN|nr:MULTISPECIES: M24 family metallopeptidase [Pacificimonas]MBZ6377712.1 aminopeptidase P family protein [Pacificimonas aurantium]OWV32610.1 peptidase M24 [Pacificimonas flava]